MSVVKELAVSNNNFTLQQASSNPKDVHLLVFRGIKKAKQHLGYLTFTANQGTKGLLLVEKLEHVDSQPTEWLEVLEQAYKLYPQLEEAEVKHQPVD